jgi:hypothetical protein
MARKKVNNQWYIVTVEEAILRKYLVEVTSAREARKMDYDELLGAIDDCYNPMKVVGTKGFPTKDEALESDDAWVEWHA